MWNPEICQDAPNQGQNDLDQILEFLAKSEKSNLEALLETENKIFKTFFMYSYLGANPHQG